MCSSISDRGAEKVHPTSDPGQLTILLEQLLCS
jgi:hypothetical protein